MRGSPAGLTAGITSTSALLYKEAMALMRSPMVPPFPRVQVVQSTLLGYHWVDQVVTRKKCSFLERQKTCSNTGGALREDD